MTDSTAQKDPRETMGGDPDSGIPRTVKDEQIILGQMLNDPEVAVDAVRGLRVSDFRDERNRTIFQAFRLGLEEDKMGIAGVITRLRFFNRLDQAGGVDYITSLPKMRAREVDANDRG